MNGNSVKAMNKNKNTQMCCMDLEKVFGNIKQVDGKYRNT